MSSSYFYKGRHRKPTHNARNTAVVTGLTAMGLGFTPAITGTASTTIAGPPGGWGPIIQCESGGRNVEHGGDPGGVSTASGYLQFVNGTWKAFGGQEFAPRAIGATLTEQLIVAERAFAANKLRDWAASASCWKGKTATHPILKPQKAPKHAKPTSRHSTDKCNYIVKKGDTLTRIGNGNWQALYEKNRSTIKNPNRIYPGQQLCT